MSYNKAKELAWNYAFKHKRNKSAVKRALRCVDALMQGANPEDALAYYGIF